MGLVYLCAMDPTQASVIQELQQAIFNQRLYNAVFAVSALISNLITIWVAVRRQPSLDKELSEFVRRPECTAFHLRARDEHNREHQDINTRLAEGELLFRTIERALGRIEGALDTAGRAMQHQGGSPR